MIKFDRLEFADRLVKTRENRGLTQTELGKEINKARSVISKYETGFIIPDIETIYDLSEALKVDVSYLLGLKSHGSEFLEDSINLFGTDVLYIYYKIPYKSKNNKGIYRINIKRNSNETYSLEFASLDNNTLYMTGRIRMNNDCAIFVFDNYKKTSPNMDVCEIIVNNKFAVDNLYMGLICGTRDGYFPTTRKCIVAKQLVDFTDEMLNRLNITEDEIEQIRKDGYWNPNIINENNF